MDKINSACENYVCNNNYYVIRDPLVRFPQSIDSTRPRRCWLERVPLFAFIDKRALDRAGAVDR